MCRIPNFTALSAAVALCTLACEGGQRQSPGEGLETGTLKAALAVGADAHDVAGLDYKVVAAADDCTAPALDQRFVPLESESMPAWMAAQGVGADHRFGDAFFVLDPGNYRVCATPVQADGTASAECAATEGVFTVVAESTTEGVIFSQCKGDPTGALDVLTALNDPPRIEDIIYDPSKFIDTCDEAVITVVASDPNGDAVSLRAELVAPDPGDRLSVAGDTLRFSSFVPGKHLLRVIAEDSVGGVSRLEIPVHVSPADVPAGAVCNPANRHAYMLTPWVGSALDARAAAQRVGGTLAAITSPEEQALLASHFNGRLWIGLSDELVEGQHRWETGEATAYTNFCPGEPNDRLGNEDFVEWGLFAQKCWNDMRNSGDPFQPGRGIIEIELP